MPTRILLPSLVTVSCFLLLLLAAMPAQAHCDRVDGPVVKEAQAALQAGEVAGVLKWVQPQQEQQVRDAFAQTLAVRQLSPQAQALADRYFFETLVRLHRASEGEPFTGLKEADTPIEPAIVAADQALLDGHIDELAQHLAEQLHQRIVAHFTQAKQARQHASHSVEAGRDFVAAYVQYVHLVEQAQQLASHGAAHHGQGPTCGMDQASHVVPAIQAHERQNHAPNPHNHARN